MNKPHPFLHVTSAKFFGEVVRQSFVSIIKYEPENSSTWSKTLQIHFALGYAISLPSPNGFNFGHSIVVAAYF